MADIDFAALTEAAAEGPPCGPDLAGDPDFENVLANAEFLLPASYFEFQRASADLDGQIAACQAQLARTRDLRLLVTLAKLLILNRDLPGFVGCMEAVGRLVDERWDDLHPHGVGGDFGFRQAVIETLDDMPHVLLPLQYTPLIDGGRAGQLTYRDHLIVSGEARARDGEAPSADRLRRIVEAVDVAYLVDIRDRLTALDDALRRIRDTSRERAPDQAIRLDRLGDLARRMQGFLDKAVAERRPDLALAGAGAAAPETDEPDADAARPETASDRAPAAVSGGIANRAEAAAALDAAAAYFRAQEPSSPALLLVRQAQQLIGLSFPEVVRIMAPGDYSRAVFSFRGSPTFALPLEALATQLDASPEDAATAPEPEEAGRSFTAETRTDAMALLGEVAGWYRVTEPSSPIPALTERAQELSSRDFATVLKELTTGDGD